MDHLLVKQEVELLEIISGMEGKNKYKILNSAGQEIFKGKFKKYFSRQIANVQF